jgi:hypothetical protein
LANRHVGQYQHKQLQMIPRNKPFQNRRLMLLADLTDQLSLTKPNLSAQGFFNDILSFTASAGIAERKA